MPDDVKYPGIARAALEIALDNGGINRFRSEARQRRELARWIERRAATEFPNLTDIEAWLATRTDEQMEAICCGGEGEPEQMETMRDAPPFTNDLLNDYFEQVC